MALQQPRLNALTPKQTALRDLEIARADVARSTTLLAEEWNPKAVMARSFEKYRPLWIGGAAVAGLAAMRYFLPAAPSAETASRDDDKDERRSGGGLLGLLKLPLLLFGKKALLNYGMQFVQSAFQKKTPDTPNDEAPDAV